MCDVVVCDVEGVEAPNGLQRLNGQRSQLVAVEHQIGDDGQLTEDVSRQRLYAVVSQV